MAKGFNPERAREKTKGKDARIDDLNKRAWDLKERFQKKWVTEQEYKEQNEKLEEERLEILTEPEE